VKRRCLPRFVIGILTILSICAIALLAHFFSHEQTLLRQFAAYDKTQRRSPRPEIVTRLSARSVPILIDWIQQTNMIPPWTHRLHKKLDSISPSLAAKFPALRKRATYYDLPQFALIGFRLLGTNGASALPKLAELASSDPELLNDGEMIPAMSAIGAPAFPFAIKFCESPRPSMRSKGVFLLGVLQTRPEIAVPLLLKRCEDNFDSVRRDAFGSLAEFPSPETEAILSKLSDHDPERIFDVAFALHSASTNALLQMLSIAENSTNRAARAALLGALAFREEIPEATALKPRDQTILRKRAIYNLKCMHINVLMYNALPEARAFDSIRSNILSGQPFQIEATLKTHAIQLNRPWVKSTIE
jgi:hypothetical protein